MKAYKDFIVHIPFKHKSTLKTESGFELLQDNRWSTKETANTIVKVIETPMNYKGEIKPNYLVFIDSTILIQMEFIKGGKQENINLVDRDKNLYKVDPSMIIAYKKNEKSSWIGFEDNVLCKRIKVKASEKKLKSGIIIPQTIKKDDKNLKIIVINEFLKNNNIIENDNIISNTKMEIDVQLNNESLVWLRNKDIVALDLR